MSVDLLHTEFGLILGTAGRQSKIDIATGDVRLLQHFQAVTAFTLGGAHHKSVFRYCVARKGFELPYLMHMTLAVSCAHLKRLATVACHTDYSRRYAIAEARHWQSGLELYQVALKGRAHDFDGALAATFLTIIFTFALDDQLPRDSYTSGDREKLMHAINPLAATGGFGALRVILGEHMMESTWGSVLQDSDDELGTFTDDRIGTAGLPAAFVNLCELDAESNAENNPYHAIVRRLTPLLRLRPCEDSFTKFIAFSGRTWRYLRPLLLVRDARALLLISYWFAMMRDKKQWWICVRAETECIAIVDYLRRSEDSRILPLLTFPASLGQADLSYIW